MANVVIVEDVKTIREGLKTLIDASKELKCVGAFESFEDFTNNLDNDLPDILLIDLDLPGISGLEGIKKLNRLSMDYMIIVLTLYEENEQIFDALSAGASSYLVKNTPYEKMVRIIKDASEGRVVMNSYIARKAFNYFNKSKGLKNLNKEEFSVLKKVVEGHSLKAIEDTMKIDVSEIKCHFRGIYTKLHKIYGYS